jgi:hypothetical protein
LANRANYPVVQAGKVLQPGQIKINHDFNAVIDLLSKACLELSKGQWSNIYDKLELAVANNLPPPPPPPSTPSSTKADDGKQDKDSGPMSLTVKIFLFGVLPLFILLFVIIFIVLKRK